MSYISGSSSDFENRLHEFPVNTGELDQYRIEGQSYTLDDGMKYKVNREYNKKNLTFGIVSTGNVF